MIRRLNQRIFVPQHEYTNPIDSQRARALLFILSIGIVVTGIYALLLLYVFIRGAELSNVQLIAAISPIISAVTYYLVNRGLLRAGIFVVITLSLVASYFSVSNGLGNPDVMTLILPIVIAGVMLDWRGSFLTIAAVIGTLFFVSVTNAGGNALIDENFPLITLLIVIVGSWITIFGSNIQAAARRGLETAEELKFILHRVSQTGINTDERQLSADVINIVRDQLGYTYARIYLTDESSNITQGIAAGLNKGQLNIDTNIRLGSQSAIYEAVRSQQPVLLDAESSETRRGHLLPGIMTAAAVPLLVERQIVGILDVQREEDRSFEADEVDMLVALAEHLAGTIVQSRLINNLRENLTAQNEIVTRQREKMLEYERAEERATTSTWTAYLQQRDLDYLGFDMAQDTIDPEFSTTLPSDMKPALETGEISVQHEDNYQVVSVPILLRGQVLGAMSFKVSEGSQTIGGRQKELIRSVVQRLGLALENKRLFEQSQSQARRESKANEVGNILLSSTDIATVLDLAAQNFNEALGAVQTKIQIQPEIRRRRED